MTEIYDVKDEENEVSSLSSRQREELLASCNDAWRIATEDYHEAGFIEAHNQAWDFYLRNKPDIKDKENHEDDDIFVRLGFIPRSVEAVKAILVSSIFPADERYFRGTPLNDVAADFQEAYELYKTSFFGVVNTIQQFSKAIICMCLDPAVAMAFHYERKQGRKVVYEAPFVEAFGVKIKLPLLGLKRVVKDDHIFWEGTTVEVLDFLDWRVDLRARNIEESFFMRRWYKPTWFVEKEYGVEDVKSYADTFEDREHDTKREELGPTMPLSPEAEPDGKAQALLMVKYDDFVLDGKVFENYSALVVNGTEVVDFRPNQYDHGEKPFGVHSLFPVPNQLIGMSLVNHALPSAVLIDKFVSDISRTSTIASKPIFEVDINEKVFRSKKKKKIKFGRSYPVRRPGQSMKQVNVNIANLTMLERMIEQLEDNIRQVTGAEPVFTGEAPSTPTNTTAFQVDQHVQGGSTRFQEIMRNFINEVVERFLRQSFENDKQYKFNDEFVEGFGTLTPDLIKQMEFQFVVTSAQAVNARAKQLQNLQFMLGTLIPEMVGAGVAQLSGEQIIVKQGGLVKDLVTKGGVRNFEDYFEIVKPEGQNGIGGVLGANGGGGGQLPPPTEEPQGVQSPLPEDEGPIQT